MSAKKNTKAAKPAAKEKPTKAPATGKGTKDAAADMNPKTAAAKAPHAKPAASPKAEAGKHADPRHGGTAPGTPLEQTPITPPAAAQAVSPAVREAQAPKLREAQAPKLREAAAPAMRTAQSPAVQATGKAAPAGGKVLQAIIAPGAGGNPYRPHVATVAEVIDETHNIKTLRVVLDDADAMAKFHFEPGQVGQLSVFGVGESTFVINTPPSQKKYLQFSVMRAGEVTEAIHKLAPGDKVGVRAPLGKPFPYAQWKGKDVFFVGGGIGMAPIRTIMLHLLENKKDYGKISLLYGARSPRDMSYSYELDGWMRNPDLDCTLTIDNPSDGWAHKVGLIPNILLEKAPKPDNCIAVLCGPPIMIKFTVEALKKLNFPDEAIITTLEKRMKCGIGICGRCNIGPKYVCVDGPVFSWAELKELPPEL